MTEQTRAVNHLNGRPLPEPATLAGYAALVDRYDLRVPLPPRMAAVAVRHHPESTDDWQLLPPRRAPKDTLRGQLEFALKWEGVDLSVLSALFESDLDAELATLVRAKPSGIYSRRLWFLFEWLTGRTLDVPTAGTIRAIPAIDPTQQFALQQGELSRRHRVINNMPGTPAFCPLVRRTATLNAFAKRGFDRLAREVVGRTHPDVLSRAAAFLLLNDSKSSFWIEGERPSAARATRWGQIIGEAGTRPLNVDEFERLQRIVIGDARFVRLGLRTEGGFVGEHDRETREPIPEHISARPEDLHDLLGGLTAYSERSARGNLDPVAAAAAIAFGFVYVHPFEDGNGRVHRWLIHHVLATASYNPRGLVFPVSAAILRGIDDYRTTLQSYSRPLLPLIEWRPTRSGNVEVLNDTGHYYRYFDATAHAEFLYRCVAQTVEHDLPDEVRFLEAFDQFRRRVHEIVDMPDRTADLLLRFLRQGGGRLSKRARDREFATLTDAETTELERAYAEHLADLDRLPATEAPSIQA